MLLAKKVWILAAGCGFIGFGTVIAQEAPVLPQAPVREVTSGEEVARMAETGMEQFALGLVGIRHGNSDSVRTFARLLVDDAVRFEKELMDLARQKGIPVAVSTGLNRPPAVVALESLGPDRFDEAFLKAAQKTAERVRKELQQLATQTSDTDFRAFAERALGDMAWRQALEPHAAMEPPPVAEGPRETGGKDVSAGVGPSPDERANERTKESTGRGMSNPPTGALSQPNGF